MSFIFVFTPHFYLLVSASPSGIWKMLRDFEWMNNHENDKTVLCHDARHDFKSLHTFDFHPSPGLVLTCSIALYKLAHLPGPQFLHL